MQYGENTIDIPLAEALNGVYKNDAGTKYGVNNKRGLMDWTQTARLICVVQTPLNNASSACINETLRMTVSGAMIVDTTFEQELARLQDMVQNPLDQGNYSDEAYQAYRAVIDRAAAAAASKFVSLDSVREAIGWIEQAQRLLQSNVIPGDADGDGKITVVDALMALQAAANKVTLTDAQTAALDVDGKDGVTAADALRILQYATGHTTAL